MCPHHRVAVRGSCVSLFVTDDIEVPLNYYDIVLTLLSSVASCTVYVSQGWPPWVLSSSFPLRPFHLLTLRPRSQLFYFLHCFVQFLLIFHWS